MGAVLQRRGGILAQGAIEGRDGGQGIGHERTVALLARHVKLNDTVND